MGRRTSRLYTKGNGRFYGDFRDLGGKQEALIPEGERFATKDPDIAAELVSRRVKELEAERRGRVMFGGTGREETLAAYVAYHLDEKAKAGKVTEGHLAEAETRLARAVDFFGAGKPLAGIGAVDAQAWTAWLGQLPGGRRGNKTLAPATVRHHLNDLSNLYRRAQSEGVVPPGFNPIAAMLEKPQAWTQKEAHWLQPHEAALLLEAAHGYAPPERDDEPPPMREILATFLLTGGRKSEVLGLAVGDVNFERRTVTFREHPWRRLKTRNARRVVTLWPQLEEILLPYLNGPDAPEGELLFPSTSRRTRGGEEQVWNDLRKPLDAIAEVGGWEEGEIRTKALRHTYCSARLQTLDRGAPVSPWTVAKEMGHGGQSLVDRVYGHLGEVRHRAEVVEYRVEVIETIPDAATRKAFEKRLRDVRRLRIA